MIDECEVATDLMWRDRASFTRILPELFDYAIRAFSATQCDAFSGSQVLHSIPKPGFVSPNLAVEESRLSK